MSLARVTPLFLAVTVFRAVLKFPTLIRKWMDIYGAPKKKRRTCFCRMRHRVTRAAGSDPVIKMVGMILQYRGLVSFEL